MGIFQPWDNVSYRSTKFGLEVFDIESGEIIVRIPVTDLNDLAVRYIYEVIRQNYLLGYSQGIDDKQNELKAVLGIY